MKTASPAMAAHLAQGQTTLAWLWKVKRVDGTILGFTTHDQDIIYDDGDGDGDVTYLASSGFTNSATASKSDLSVDNLEVTAFLDSDSITEDDLRAHLYDDAIVAIRVINWADLTMGHITLRRGTLGVVKMSGGMGTSEIRGLANKLTTSLGATFGPICRAEWGSGLNGIDMNSKYLCKIDVTLWRQTGTLDFDAPDPWTFVPSVLYMIGSATPGTEAPPGWFVGGIIKFTSGVLNGLSFEIKSNGTALEEFKLFLPMPYLPSHGDTFEIEPGCNHTIFDCQNKFVNIVNFRGEPFLPGQDRILDYPNAN
jgi:uncharacterized phage protein (TIGR02218 family)